MIKRFLTAVSGVLSGMILAYAVVTSGSVQAQSTSCELVNNNERMQVLFAPMYSDAQVKDVLPKGAPYTMIGESDSYFWIEYGDGERGWINWHTRTNGICDAFQLTYTSPEGDIPLTEFPTVCLFTINETTTGYTDSNMGIQHRGFGQREPGTYGVNVIVDDAVGLYGDISMSGGFVEMSSGTFSGHCSGTRQLAYTLDNARVWTQPDATAGTVITTLETGIDVGVISEPVAGNIQDDLIGDWVQVVRGDVIGWMWVDRLEFGRIFTARQPIIRRAVTGDNARIWSAPDAKTGQVTMTVMAGLNIYITGEPVTGNIQLDTDLQGTWYPVQFGGNAGWMYKSRIAEFID